LVARIDVTSGKDEPRVCCTFKGAFHTPLGEAANNGLSCEDSEKVYPRFLMPNARVGLVASVRLKIETTVRKNGPPSTKREGDFGRVSTHKRGIPWSMTMKSSKGIEKLLPAIVMLIDGRAV
jgi:hypothetical protein